jgi:prepilin-type N-terminal cleavage/methylation domain-containing protein
MPNHRHGFSLVELSIVLVILGLLVGGILSGQSLIRASELRGVSTDVQRITAAVMTFRDKYIALPGDMINASAYWSAQANGGKAAACGDTESSGKATCDGNGDGEIDNPQTDGVWEKLRAWQHLANAGLMEGSYRGAPNAADDALLGSHWPVSKFKPGGYEMTHWTTNMYGNPPAHFIKIAKRAAADDTGLNGGLLKPEEGWNLDQKMDDGKSDSGRLVAIDGSDVAAAGDCVTNGATYAEGTTGSYVLTKSGQSCRFYFYTGF